MLSPKIPDGLSELQVLAALESAVTDGVFSGACRVRARDRARDRRVAVRRCVQND